MLEFFKTILGTPESPAARSIAFIMALLVLVLTAPLIYNSLNVWLEPYIIQQYGREFGPPILIAVWLIVFPGMFLMMKESFCSSFGMLVTYMVNILPFF